MAVQVKHRRDTSANCATFTGAQGEIIMDTTNTILRLQDGTTTAGWPIANATRTGVADAAYVVLITDRYIAYTSISTARAVTLPAASAYPVGALLTVADESGSVNTTNTITLNRAGSDTIDGQTSAVILQPYGSIALESNGSNAWTVIGPLVNNQIYSGALTAATALTMSSSYQSGGVTLTNQILAIGSVWRIKARGNYVSISSGNSRQLSIAAFWGATQLTAVVSGNVLASTIQTTPWFFELEITASSTTAAWNTGHIYNHLVTAVASAEIAPLVLLTPASVTGLSAGPQTLDCKFLSSGTATGDACNVQNLTIERLR